MRYPAYKCERPVYDSTFSSSLSSRSARKTQVRSRKKHRNGKNTFGSRKKRPAAGKSYFRSGKNASKKCRFAAGKIQSSRKNTLQQHKSTFAAEKMHFGGSGKNRPRREKPVRGKKKTGRGRKKSSSRESPALQPKKLPQRKKYISATGKSSSPGAGGCLFWTDIVDTLPGSGLVGWCLESVFFVDMNTATIFIHITFPQREKAAALVQVAVCFGQISLTHFLDLGWSVGA